VCPVTPSGAAGPVIAGAALTVFIDFLPAARMADPLACADPPDAIAAGSPSVFIEGRAAARIGDATGHLGAISTGSTSVMIG
jgi:uncharacterized Zn-binding protein involved in type VI secretion